MQSPVSPYSANLAGLYSLTPNLANPEEFTTDVSSRKSEESDLQNKQVVDFILQPYNYMNLAKWTEKTDRPGTEELFELCQKKDVGVMVIKPMTGHCKKGGQPPLRFLREVRLQESTEDTKLGDRVLVDGFVPGEFVDVVGVSKGRGFQGGVKRWHYRGGDATHGSMFHRAPCPAKAIELNWYEDDQVMSKVDALLEGVLP